MVKRARHGVWAVFLLGALGAKAEPPAWPMKAELHPLVREIPPQVEESLQTVGRYLGAREQDPYQLVKALHDYVTTRIAYAVFEYETGTIGHELADPRTVFRTQRGVCAGYARLMQALGESAGIDIRYVEGVVRRLEGRRGVEVRRHAWNAVFLDGRWHQLDATWDAGTVGQGRFRRRYSTLYLFSPPEVFSYTHFADGSQAQLRPPGLTEATFRARPYLEPQFFAHRVRLVHPREFQVPAKGSLELEFDNPGRAAIHVSAMREGGGGALCYPTHCGEAVCGAGQVCWHDSCVERGCTGGTCFSGTRCRDRKCVRVSCASDADCYPTESCRAGKCEGMNAFADTAETARRLHLSCELPQPGTYRLTIGTRSADDPDQSAHYWNDGYLLAESHGATAPRAARATWERRRDAFSGAPGR